VVAEYILGGSQGIFAFCANTAHPLQQEHCALPDKQDQKTMTDGGKIPDDTSLVKK
jgi:hypothetical protein